MSCELVSVIIPTHFRADRLSKAVESVCRQTWSNLEILVVSDGDDKETNELMEKVTLEDPRVHFVSYPESKGGNHARNIGIEQSTGAYIAFLDDDDIWYPEKVQQQYELLISDSNIGLVGCAIRVIHANKNISYNTFFEKEGNLSKEILFSNLIGSTSCVMLKREAIENCGVFDEELPARQDHDLWIRICQRYNVKFIKNVLVDYYVYDSQGKSIQTSKSLEKYLKAHEIISNKYKYLIDSLSLEDQRILEAKRNLAIAQRASSIGNLSKVREYSRKSWKIKKSKIALWYSIFWFIPYDFLVYTKASYQKIFKRS